MTHFEQVSRPPLLALGCAMLLWSSAPVSAASSALALSSPAPAVSRLATDVLVVGPRPGPGVDFTQISDAIAAAAEGDIIRVQPNPFELYEPFTIDGKGLSLLSTDRTQRIGISTPSIRNLASGQIVRMAGFAEDELTGSFLLENNAGMVYLTDLQLASMQILDSAGGTWLVDCRLDLFQVAPSGAHALEVVNSRRVTLQGCNLQAGPGGSSLFVTGSTLYAYDCRFRGPLAAPGGAAGSPGVVSQSNGLFYMEKCSLQGGDATQVDGQCDLPGGPALLFNRSADLYSTSLTGGLGRTSCTTEVTRARGWQVIRGGGGVGNLRRTERRPSTLSAPSRVLAGESVTFDLEGPPGATAIVFYSPVTVNNYQPALGSGTTLYLPSSRQRLFTVLLDGQGQATYSLKSALPAGVSAMEMYVQATFIQEIPPIFGLPPNYLASSNPRRILFLGK